MTCCPYLYCVIHVLNFIVFAVFPIVHLPSSIHSSFITTRSPMFHSLREAASQAASAVYSSGLAMTRSVSSSRTIRPRSLRRTSTATSTSPKQSAASPAASTSSSPTSESLAQRQKLQSPGQLKHDYPPQHVSDESWLDSNPFAFNVPTTQQNDDFAACVINLSRNILPQRPRTRHGRQRSYLIAPPLDTSPELWPESSGLAPTARAVDSLEEACKVLALMPGILDVRVNAQFPDDGYEESLRRRRDSGLPIARA